jgi:hypothetical protein
MTLAFPLLGSCSPPNKGLTLGDPPAKALKTSELAADADRRIATLAAQVPLSANSIFTNYGKGKNSQWASGWPIRLDLTGVCWSHKKAGTAITPRHIVMAAHWGYGPGQKVIFHDRAGNPHVRHVEKRKALNRIDGPGRSDILVCLLDEPLPPEINTYRLLPPREDYTHTLPGSPAFITEQERRVFIHEISRQSHGTLSFRKHPNLPDELYKPLVVGDSGNPSFLLVGGEPVLIETHTGGGPGSGPFYSAPKVFAALQEVVAELDPSYQIQTVPLDPKRAPAPPEKKKKTAVKTQRTVNSSTQNQTNETTPAPSDEESGERIPRVRRVPTPPEE